MVERRSRLYKRGRWYASRPKWFDRVPRSPLEKRMREWDAFMPAKVYTGIPRSIYQPDEIVTGSMPEHLFCSEEEMERGRIAGFNVRHVGILRLCHPRISRRDYLRLKELRKPELVGRVNTLMSLIPRVPKQARDVFIRRRKVISTAGQVGPVSSFAVVPRIYDAMDEEEFGAEHDLTPDQVRKLEQPMPGSAGRKYKSTFSLEDLLNDEATLKSLNVPLRIYEGVKRLSATRPLLAAKALQAAINKLQTKLHATVTTSIMGDSARHSMEVIDALTECYASNKLVRTQFSGKTMIMFGDDGRWGWSVSGPMKHAVAIKGVYWMVAAEGTHIVNAVLSCELIALGINISEDGKTCSVTPIEFHTAGPEDKPLLQRGVHPDLYERLPPPKISTIKEMTDRVLEVREAESGRAVASAIRVTGREILINTHVTEGGVSLEVGDGPVMCRAQVSRDLWVAENTGFARAWKFREPVVGESAVLVYRTGDIISTSAVLRVVALNGAAIVLSGDESIVGGCSGAALVGLSDLSLLGVYSSATASNLLAYRFGSEEMAAVLDHGHTVTVPDIQDPSEHAQCVYDSLTASGVGSYLEDAVDCMTPVYALTGEQVGMAVNLEGRLYTTCDATMPLRFGPSRSQLECTTEIDGRLYSAVPNAGTSSTLGYVRKPRLGERVFAVGVHEDGVPQISLSSTVVHVMPDFVSFHIKQIPDGDFSMVGGLIMGSDGAVLGQMGPAKFHAFGLTHACWPLRLSRESPVTSPRQFLINTFPFLHVETWPDDLLQEIFTHASAGNTSLATSNVGQKPLSAIGQSAAAWVYHRMLHRLKEPHASWVDIFQERMKPANFAELAWKFKLADCLVVAPGISCPRQGKVYSDLYLALLGAVSLMEKFDVLRSFCVHTGLLPDIPLDGG